MALTLNQRHTRAGKQRLLHQLSYDFFQLIWMEFGMLSRLVSVMNLILLLSNPFHISGREPYLCDFDIKKEGNKADINKNNNKTSKEQTNKQN